MLCTEFHDDEYCRTLSRALYGGTHTKKKIHGKCNKVVGDRSPDTVPADTFRALPHIG